MHDGDETGNYDNENRIGIKILTQLFMKGLGYANNNKLPTS